MPTRIKLHLLRIWANRQTILSSLSLLLAAIALLAAINESQKRLEIIKIPVCYATRDIEAGEKVTMDSGAIHCTQVEVAVKDPQSAKFSFTPGAFITSPQGEMIARGKIKANEVVAAHDFVAFPPIQFPTMVINLPGLKADRDYVLVRPIPSELSEMLPFPPEARYLVVHGYCHVMEGDSCLFAITKIVLRDGEENVVFSASGSQVSYDHLVLLFAATGIGEWQTNYPAVR